MQTLFKPSPHVGPNLTVPDHTALELKHNSNDLQELRSVSMFSEDIAIGVVCMDEIHQARTNKTLRGAMSALSRKSFFVVGASATPIISSPVVSLTLHGACIDQATQADCGFLDRT